jgi:hypothetical protein
MTTDLKHMLSPLDNDKIPDFLRKSNKDILKEARDKQIEVVAMCGFKWVPENIGEGKKLCEDCITEGKGLVKRMTGR